MKTYSALVATGTAELPHLPARVRRSTTLERVIVNSTVQEKAIAFPTDSRLLDVARRIHTQRPKDKNELYALHSPRVERIGKGKARQPYEFGVKVGIATTEKGNLIVGARAFPGNPYDGHTFAEQIEQATILMQDVKGAPKPPPPWLIWAIEALRCQASRSSTAAGSRA